MNEINWNQFMLRNPNPQEAFETMCRNIFLRQYKVSSHGFSANYNQSGLETEPVLFENKYYGFQCKYSTSGNGDALYAEVLDSLQKAVKVYPNLNTVIVYTNLNVKPNVSPVDLLKPKKSNRVKIYELGKNNNVEICWFVKPNFEQVLNEVGNYDLYRYFFSSQDADGLLNSALSHDERTFLVSDQFIDLSLNGQRLSDVKEEILQQEISIITGAAGTGKSEILKSLYLQFEERYLSNAKEAPSNTDVPIPVFVRLRECINGNLEGLLRNRLKDFEINPENKKNCYVYFFDGLDEVNTLDFSGMITCIIRLKRKDTTKSILFASRTNSANLTSVLRELKPKIFSVDPLKSSDVEDYFSRLNNPDKQRKLQEIKEKLPTLFNEITDIFSAVLLSESICEIEENTTKIDLILLNTEKLIEGNRKYSFINLPEPKTLSIERILAQVSLSMQRTGNISVTRSELQDVISTLFPNCSYVQVDETIDFISEMFFDSSSTNFSQRRYSYRHKRYFEFYLYNAIKNEFYNNPSILRELRLLSNKDFILNIFLIQELKNHTLDNNVHRILALRFFEAYLGEDYMSDTTSSWFMPKRLLVPGTDSYLQSEQLQEYLCTKHIHDLEDFLKTDPLSIRGFLKEDNYYTFVKQYHEANGSDILPLLNKIYDIKEQWLKKAAVKDPEAFFYCKCVIEQTPIEDFFKTISSIKDVHTIDLDRYPYNRNGANIVVDFFDLALVSFRDWLLSIMSSISAQHLDVLCYILLGPRHLSALLNHGNELNQLSLAIIHRVSSCETETYGIHTIVLFGILTGSIIQKNDIEARAAKSNVYHYETWRTNYELNSYIGMLLGEDFHPAHPDYELGIALRQIVHNCYPIKKSEILTMILQEVNKYNLVYKNAFSYRNAIFIGEVIASLDIDTSNKKRFLIELRKYDSVVSTFQVLYTVMKRNVELFKVLTNPSFLTAEYSKASQVLSYYDYNSDLAFKYATMMSHFDIVKADALFENAINNSIFRPIFRKEDMLDYHLPNCMLTAYNNFWFTGEEIELMINRVEDILKIAKDTLDSGAYSEYFTYLVEHCCPYLSDSHQIIGEKAENPEKAYGWEKYSSNVPIEGVTSDNLQQYYNCEIDGINYSSFSVWKYLIRYELENNKELTLLYETLSSNYFPSSNFSKINHCFHIIIAVLITNAQTKPKAIEYLMEHAGRMGLVILIRSYALIGDAESGCECIEQLMRLCEAMVYPSSEHIRKRKFSTNETRKIIDSVCNSSVSDWNRDEEDCIMHYLPDSKITIKWDQFEDHEPFSEKWATSHPDKKAYRTNYYVCYEQKIIKTFVMVHVDGYRALIPIPDLATNHIDRNSYGFARLVNTDVETLNQYIIRSGLIVD